MTHGQHDYLAIIPIGCGSSFGRSPDKEKAIKLAISSYKDWMVLYEVANTEVIVNVIDVQGYDEVHWGSYPESEFWGTSEATGKNEPIKRSLEYIKRTTPNWKRKK